MFLQSAIDFFASVILLISSLTLEDTTKVRREGILGQLECRLWNTEFFLWALFFASTWNIVAMTIERYVSIVSVFCYYFYKYSNDKLS